MTNKLLEEIYYKYKSKMYYLAYNYLKDQQTAEDIVHDALVLISEKIESGYIDSKTELPKIITVIIKGLSIDYIRRSNKVIYRELTEKELGVTDSDKKAIDLINSIESNNKNILIYRFIKGLTYKEIAKKVNKKESNLRKIVEREKIKIKRLIVGEYEEKNY